MYQSIIRAELARQGLVGKYDPRHIEAYMRVRYSTLDHLPASQFRQEISLCCKCVDDGGQEYAERLAQSYGL